MQGGRNQEDHEMARLLLNPVKFLGKEKKKLRVIVRRCALLGAQGEELPSGSARPRKLRTDPGRSQGQSQGWPQPTQGP